MVLNKEVILDYFDFIIDDYGFKIENIHEYAGELTINYESSEKKRAIRIYYDANCYLFMICIHRIPLISLPTDEEINLYEFCDEISNGSIQKKDFSSRMDYKYIEEDIFNTFPLIKKLLEHFHNVVSGKKWISKRKLNKKQM